MGKNQKEPAGLSVAVCLPGENEIKHVVLEGEELAGLQGLVGGYIEKVGSLEYDDHTVIDVMINEEGMLHHLPSNRLVYIPGRGQFPVLGPIVLVGANPHTGESVSLDVDMLAEAMEHARTWPMAPKARPAFRVTRLG